MITNRPKAYIAKPLNAHGLAEYTVEENAVWEILMGRQMKLVPGRACEAYLKGLELLQLPNNRIPQCQEISAVLNKITGFSLEPVPALISFDRFFELLASRRFPAATFIRRREELDYLKEPDIFHEIFGHSPLLTNPAYAEFTHTYGKLGLKATKEERILLARLFWFTVEFGLIQTPQGLRAYGGGILSSVEETIYCLESKTPTRRAFDTLTALTTPYRIDTLQPIYFILNDFSQLFDLVNMDLLGLIRKTQQVLKKAPTHPC